MQPGNLHADHMFNPIEDAAVLSALNELGRSINLITTYGKNHPAADRAVAAAADAMQKLFIERKKVIIGSFNGALTIDEVPVLAQGTLLKSLERRLTRLRITGLRITRGTTQDELGHLANILSSSDADEYAHEMQRSGLSHIASEDVSFKAVHEDQSVANNSELAGMDGNGVLVLEDDSLDNASSGTGEESSVHVEQIVAFLKGDIEADEGSVGDDLTEAASDPARLGQMIMESVAIRQAASALSGESLSDVVLGCLRRTFDGLRKQPAFQTTEGVADLQKALLLLEESMLDKMRDLAGEANPEVDRQIVQAIREMDESLGFELAARQYVEHRECLEENKQQLQSFLQSRGSLVAESLLETTGFPSSDWRKIVVDSGGAVNAGANPPIAAGLSTLATVFEKLESVMKSKDGNENELKDLLGQANENLDDTIDSTREKLDTLSKQLGDTGTIGGQAQVMSRKELLSSISEVAQELMQPLTAINASLEMMIHGYVGSVSNDQLEMLNLAYNSGEHLKFLMKELINIVGLPENKGVDHRFHTTSEQVVLMKSGDAT
ncbi:hypothetical protein [Pontiella sulfatireligans]|uniref:histidine kinase n=1 Tax=Pontiella sulfatireligans TaxID=2750658 RepID=A0A6C2UWV4_9BACT|nr:hypothetical protein [Pontiella sulfatireligans]VGO23326.1 hypothetical protein SCARR_05433 [Pontiella sulfatireligans]